MFNRRSGWIKGIHIPAIRNRQEMSGLDIDTRSHHPLMNIQFFGDERLALTRSKQRRLRHNEILPDLL
jgi:hypothetical protein